MAVPSLRRRSVFADVPAEDEQDLPPRTAGLYRNAGLDPRYAALQAETEQAAAIQREDAAADMGQTRRAWQQGMAQLSATPDAVRGLYRNLTGPEGSGDRYLLRADQITERAAEYAPEVQTLGDINGVGDALAYGRNALVSNAPTLLPTVAAALATGGTAGVIAGGARAAGQQALKEGAKRGVRSALRRSVTPTRAAAAGAFVPAAGLQANQMVDVALDDTQGGTARERAAKATAGALGTAAIDVLPVMQLLGRFGLAGQAKRQISGPLAKRMATQAAGQAGTEATTEAIQTFGERLTHKWVNDNVEVLSAEALSEYANAFVAGGLAGGVLGAPAGIADPAAAKARRERVIERERQFRAGQRAPAKDVQDVGATPGAAEPGSRAPAEQFKEATDTVETNEQVADTLGQTPPPAAPPAPAQERRMQPGESGPADSVTERFDRAYNDLDVAQDDDFEGEYNDLSAWLKTQGMNTPAMDRNSRTYLDSEGNLIFKSVNLGIDSGGVTRGPISSEPLFNPNLAKQIQLTSRAGGKLGLTSPQAIALSVLDSDAAARVSRDAVREAALYLTTGKYDAKSPALREYLSALPKAKRLQLHYFADAWSNVVAELREQGETGSMSISEMSDRLTGRQGRAQQISPEEQALGGFDERIPQTDARGREVQELADLISNAEMKNIGGDLGRFTDPRSGKLKDGYMAVTDARGGAKAVSLRALRTMVSKLPGFERSFSGPNADMQRLATGLGVLVQKGYRIAPDAIRAGLVIKTEKNSQGERNPVRLTPAQAGQLRRELELLGTHRGVRMPPSPGLPGPPTTDRLELDPEQTTAAQSEIDRTPSRALRPGARPQELRVGPEGQLAEAQELDAGDDARARNEQRRAYESVFYNAAGRLANALGADAIVPRGDIRGAFEAVENFFIARPGLENAPLGKAVRAAMRNLEEYQSEPKTKERKVSRRKPTKLAKEVAKTTGNKKVREIVRGETFNDAESLETQDTGRNNQTTIEGARRGPAPIETARGAGDVLTRKQDDASRTPSPALEERIAAANKRRAARRVDVRQDQDAEQVHREVYGDRDDMFPATHDSPHKFDGKFNWRENKYKGEGAMVFGAGTYLSTADGVHRHYKDLFTARIDRAADKKIPPELQAARDKVEKEQSNLEVAYFLLEQGQNDVAEARSELAKLQHLYKLEQAPGYEWMEDGTFASPVSLGQIGEAKKDLFKAEKRVKQMFVRLRQDKAAVEAAKTNAEKIERDLLASGKYSPPPISALKSPTYQVTVKAKPDEIIDWSKQLRAQPGVLAKLQAALSGAKKKKVVEKWHLGTWEQQKNGDWSITSVADDDSFGEVYYVKKTERGYEVGTHDGYGIFQAVGAWPTLAEAKAQVKDETVTEVVDSPLIRASVLGTVDRNVSGEALYNRIVSYYVQEDNKIDWRDDDDISAAMLSDAKVKASDYLQSIGFVGHRFPSAGRGSRNDAQPNYVIYDDSRITTNFVKFDQDLSNLIADEDTPGSVPKMQALVDALSSMLGLAKVTVESGARGSFGEYWQGQKKIKIALSKRKGAAQIDTLLHEFGHHIIAENWGALPPEMKKAILKDYVKWRRQARQAATFGEARATRAPAFIKKWLSSRNGKGQNIPYADLTPQQRRDLLSVHEYMADQLARALSSNAKTRGAVAEFFVKIAEQMKRAYDALVNAGHKPAESVEAWVQHMLKTEAARVVNSANTIEEQHQLLEETGMDVPVSPPPTTPGQGRPGNGAGRPNSLFYALNADDRGTLLRVLRDRNVYRQIYDQAPQEVRDKLDMFGEDMATLVDYAVGLFVDGKLKVAASWRSPLRRLADLFKLAVGLPTDRALTELVFNDWANGRVVGRNGKRYDAMARAFRGYNDSSGKRVTPGTLARRVHGFNRAVQRTIGPLYERLLIDAGQRLRDSNVPAMAKIAVLIEPRTGEKTGGDIGYQQGMEKRWQGMMVDYFKITENLTTEEKRIVQRALQRGRVPKPKKLATATTALRGFMEKMYAEAVANGIDVSHRKDFWPVMMDRAAVRNDPDGLKELLLNPKFEEDIRAFFSEKKKDGKTTPDTRSKIEDLVDRLVIIAETADESHVGEVDFSQGVIAPSFVSQKARIMGFINSLGSEADRKAFAKYQLKDLDAVAVRYTRSLAKRIEFSARFIKTRKAKNAKGEEVNIKYNALEELKEQAQRQGASREDLQQITDFINMAVGSYKAELNPAIKWVFSKWDALAGTKLADMDIERWGSIQQGWMTYQNLRILPLAAFSSLIDPLGVFVRGGSAAGDTWASFRDAVRAMKRENPTQLRAMAEAMGIVESHALSDALAATYGGSFDPSGVAGRLNNMLFKFNGLEAITRYSRLAALAMGHRFLLNHATNLGPNSVRYLQELGLAASDVKADPNNPAFVVMTPKVKDALYRFVEESVIRPKPTQRPNWHNDPNFMFASQYKGYLYSFWNTVPKRMMHEMDQGNVSAALTPLLPYVGVTLVAEMLRDMVQGDEEDKKDWGPGDYATHALVRTGALGPRFGAFSDMKNDTDYGSSVFNTWIGPTGQQMSQVGSAALGDRDVTNTAIEALPGSVIFEDWFRE